MVGFLYGQSGYQMLENSIRLEDYVSFMKDNSFSFASITDDYLISSYKFVSLCHGKGLKPIIGMRIKIASFSNYENYILIYAKNLKGYQNLVKIANEYRQKGLVGDNFIHNQKEGLTIVSSLSESDLEHYLYISDEEMFEKELKRLEGLTGDFYMGVMAADMMYDELYEKIKNINERNRIRILPLNKASYLKGNRDAYLALLKIGGKEDSDIGDIYLKNQKELLEDFSLLPNVFWHLEEFVNSCEDYNIAVLASMPTYQNQLEIDNSLFLSELCKKGVERRLKNKNKLNKLNQYKERLDYEMKIIESMKYVDYFLIVYEFVNFAKHQKIMVGPGRGSACGSLVAYALGITDVDPLEYSLLFERFLNPERVTMPDIDIDFPDNKRMDVIRHTKDIYGQENVLMISTFQKFQTKNTIHELFRIYDLDPKYIPAVLKYLDGDEQVLKDVLDNRKIYLDIIEYSKVLNGLPKSLSIHPSGIVLTKNSALNDIPVFMTTEGLYQTYYEAHDLEELGFLKVDFLGISNLNLIANVTFALNNRKEILADQINLEDAKTFALLQNGDTNGVFQLEGYGIKKVLKDMKPSSFNDLVALLALYRPGPIEMIGEYIARKNGKKFTYIDSTLEPILKETYGIIIYQEQIMEIVKKVANYSLAEADIIRRGIAKKDKMVFDKMKEDFITRAINNNYSLNQASMIYDEIVRFSGYGFNKSHSVAYSFFAYQMAYLKANYPAVFYAKMLDNLIGNEKEILQIINEIKAKKIKLLNPDIDKSDIINKSQDNIILLSLRMIKGINYQIANKIVEERNKKAFSSLSDLKTRLKDINQDVFYNIVGSQALSRFGDIINLDRHLNDPSFGYIPEDEVLEINEQADISILEKREKEALGFNIKFDSFSRYDELKKQYLASEVDNLVINKIVNVVGIINKITKIKAKNNLDMAFVLLNVNHSFVEAIFFSDVYEKYEELLVQNKLVLVNGVVRDRKGETQIQVNKMKYL